METITENFLFSDSNRIRENMLLTIRGMIPCESMSYTILLYRLFDYSLDFYFLDDFARLDALLIGTCESLGLSSYGSTPCMVYVLPDAV